MKRLYIIISLMFMFSVAVSAQTKPVDKVKTKATQISKKLKLDESTSNSVYNVVKHIDTRIKDLAFGTDNYEKLIGYIAEEREQMMKVALSKDKFKEYRKYYSDRDKNEIRSLITKNESFVKREKAKNEREERLAKSIMERDMRKAATEDKKTTTLSMK